MRDFASGRVNPGRAELNEFTQLHGGYLLPADKLRGNLRFMNPLTIFGLGLLLATKVFAADDIILADFEDGKLPRVNETTFKVELATDPEQVKEGTAALKLDVDYSLDASGVAAWKVPQGGEISQETGNLSMWIKGEGKLQFSFETADKGVFSVEKTLTGTEWQELVIPLSEFVFNKHSTTTPADAATELNTSELKKLVLIVYRGIDPLATTTTFYIDSIKLVP